MLMPALASCNKTPEIDSGTTSRLVCKASNEEMAVRAAGNDAEQVVFTGDDILWFNASTKEIRFQNNILQKDIIQGVLSRTIKFYLDDEYLFSSMNCVSSLNSQIFDNLVFYYDMIENRFYFRDGYPDVSVLSPAAGAGDKSHQERRDRNMEQIKPEWDKFVHQLKLENKYREL
jgi:hypothetical protein